jgi:hypothetical protein
MGYSNTQTTRNYFKIKSGYVVTTIKETDKDKPKYASLIETAANVETYLNKNGEKVVDICYRQFEGYLQNISLNTEGKFGITWLVEFLDAPDIYTWEIPVDNMTFQSFVNCLLSCETDFGKLRLKPWLSPKTERTSLYIDNGSEPLNWAVKYEDLPPVKPMLNAKGEEIKDAKGNTIYDTSARMEWLKSSVAIIQEKLKQLQAVEPNRLGETEDDSVPF